MHLFCNFAQVALNTFTNITAAVPLEIMNEVTSCLNCIPVANTSKREVFLYYFPLFSLEKKADKTKGQICKALSAKVQNLSKSSSSYKGKQVAHYPGTWITFGAMLLLRFVLHYYQQGIILTISVPMFLRVRCSI
jgi:hypothetical protein